MLQGVIPVDMITGMMVLHAEKISPLHIVSFITRLYREKNTTGFLKAFTDQPEHITSGLSPLKNVMKELGLRRVSIYPRFHQNIKDCLERKRADVVELAQNLTESMAEIHGAIVHCMNMILSDLRRSKDLDLDSLSLPAAYFSSFDHIVRKQLDPIWHKVGSTTKGLVRDLGVLRKLVTYLLSYDPLQFHTYCQSLLASINEPESRGTGTGRTSEWMMTDSASTIFQLAKNRCFITIAEPEEFQKDNRPPTVVDLIDDEDIWDAVNEAEGLVPTTVTTSSKAKKKNNSSQRPKWLPPNLHPVLEELPKWSLLAEILEEIEYEILRFENHSQNAASASAVEGTNTTLVMCSGTATCGVLTEFLQKMDTGGNKTKGEWGRKMMLGKLKSWLFWERKRQVEKEGGGGGAGSKNRGGGGGTAAAADARRGVGAATDDGGVGDILNEALKRKDREKAQKQASRRRVRGGAPSDSSRATTVAPPGGPDTAVVVPRKDDDPWSADIEMQLIAMDDEELQLNLAADAGGVGDIISNIAEFNKHYGLIPPAEQVLVRAYSDDTDDRMLDEIKPRFIVMYEPCMEFVRRVEVYKACNPHMGVRVYHMVYNDSCEEHKYLAGIRREKDSFERLIKERGSMLLPIFEDRSRSAENSDAIVKTISTRLAGGRRELKNTPSQVIVDMREFRSTLPSLLHAANLVVVPATLTVGDYILTPEICVERKSLSDLVSSFSSGRLYTQCELMSAHYKNPVLLIEFEEDKAFSLDMVSEIKSYVKPVNKFPPKKKALGNKPGEQSYQRKAPPSIQSKIVLLTLTFPRLRIIWSPSPYATADIFNDLKKDRSEPDVVKAVSTGADEDPEAGAGVNAAAEDLLRSFPGITSKNVKFIMSKVRNVRELCEMSLAGVQAVLGAEPGKACFEFLHRGERR
ncbi:hypothetical protein E1B28_009490 [Marasmius oreades]|nr:uncharacterized protein E1B28_009490 [Marasmius oreades]KAG7090371.1 hypothetical protein E1B28_009490 [Marasmius oreades]